MEIEKNSTYVCRKFYERRPPKRTNQSIKLKLKMLLKSAGNDVKYINEYRHLSCPQFIYRWFKGKVLPSVEHLCVLSKLLNVHMEDLLVLQGESALYSIMELLDDPTAKRLLTYAKYLQKVA